MDGHQRLGDVLGRDLVAHPLTPLEQALFHAAVGELADKRADDQARRLARLLFG